MFKNYFRSALRNLWKNKTFSSIKILGLTLGLACSLLIALWVNDEYSIDAFHSNGSQIYSVIERQYRDGAVSTFYGGPGILAEEMKRVLPEVQLAANYAWNQLATFEANNKILKQTGNFAGADFFKIFSYPILQGSAQTALQGPLDIAVSEKMAKAFFGSPRNAIGKTIRYQDKTDLKITTVFADLPANSSAQFDYILSWKKFLQANTWAENWTNNGPATYLMLRKGTDAQLFEKKIATFLNNYNKEQTPHSYLRLGMAPYGKVYLHSNFDNNGNIAGGRIQYVQLFTLVAVFMLLIAAINFINLTTARAVKRAREIGVRKVAGASRIELIKQFMAEVFFIIGIAVILSLALAVLILPLFNQLTGKQIHIPFDHLNFWISLTGLILLTGIFSGSYPALYLSSFKPALVLKGMLKFSSSGLWFRKGLVVFQFALSIILIIATIVVSRQVTFIQKMSIGYDRENLVYIPLEGELAAKYELFKNEAAHMPGVKMVSRILDAPTQIENGTGGIDWEGKDPNLDIDFTNTAVGYDFVKTLHLQLAQGRDFSKEYGTDSVNYIINEAALKIIGYKDPVGKPLTQWGKPGTIIGILKDFHFNSVHSPITPLVLRLGENLDFGTVLVRTESGQTKEALSSLEKMCKDLNPKFPFTYKFSDEEYAKLYSSEQVINELANYFALLAIFISCLGLLGLVIFTAEQRTKEFGIRKVLGASPVSLFGLLSKDFILLVTIAFVIASPLAAVGMNKWLEQYIYRISISWWMFVVAGSFALLIALITMSFQAIRSAGANPVKSLRSE